MAKKINAHNKIVCAVCGSDDIMLKNWYNPNTLEAFGWDESEECFCKHCNEMTPWAEEHRIYEEVRCDYNTTDGFWTVDAWYTHDGDVKEEDEGVVIAVINSVTGGVYAIKELDDLAKRVIQQKVDEICEPKNQLMKDGERRQIWVRLGVLVCGDAQQIESVINGDDETLINLVKEQKFFIDGNSYIPESSIEEYNEDYGTNHPIKDVEFEL